MSHAFKRKSEVFSIFCWQQLKNKPIHYNHQTTDKRTLTLSAAEIQDESLTQLPCNNGLYCIIASISPQKSNVITTKGAHKTGVVKIRMISEKQKYKIR